MTKRNIRILKETIDKINEVIAKVHTLRVDFSKGSIHQRLVSDLDEARITARAIIHQEEHPDEYPTPQRTKAKRPSGRVRNSAAHAADNRKTEK